MVMENFCCFILCFEIMMSVCVCGFDFIDIHLFSGAKGTRKELKR